MDRAKEAVPSIEEAFVQTLSHYFPVVLAKVPLAEARKIVAAQFAFVEYMLPLLYWILCAGRLLSASIECYFCQSFFERLAKVEDSKAQGQKKPRTVQLGQE